MAKPIQKERENRSADKRDLIFHPFTITPETAHTSILLLLAKEPEVLCQTLRALTKFASQDNQNRLILFDQEAISYILPHLDHAELNIRRYALKALALLCQLPQGPEQVLPNQNNLKKVAQHLVKGEDVFVLEFASLVLAELTREPVGCEQLVAANILGTLFSRMKNSQDPDVQKNCLQTLSNLLDDPVCAPEVTKNPNFSWPSLLALTTSQFLGIQHAALRTVDQLICRYKDQVVQKTFRSSTGVLELCDILESYEFRDVHTQVLGVLRNYVEIEENAAHLYQSGCIFRLLAYLEMALPAMKPHCLAVLAKMSNTAAGREALYQTGTDLVFCQQLLTSNIELLADSALGVSNMTKLMPSALRMCDTNIIEALSSITCDESAPWFNTRVNAVRALAALSSYIPKAAYAVVEPKTFTAIRAINKKYKETPIEAQRLAVQCYINLLNYHISMNAMLNAEFMSELLNILQRIDTTLKIMACTVLTGMMSEQAGKDLFTLKGGEEVVSENLEIEHIGLRTALCTLIIASVTDEGADQYLEMGTLHYMVENKQARYVVSAWEPAIEAIFDHEPSAKFAYRGRLEINDFTREGFYVMKRLESPLPTLRKLAFASPPHRHPALVALFMPPLPPKSDLDINNGNTSATRLSVSRHSRVRLPSLADDHNLREYLLKLKLWFGDPRLQLQLQLNRNRSSKLPHPFLSYGIDSAGSQDSAWTIERSSCGEYNYQDSKLDILLKRDTHEALSRAYLINQSLREFCTTTKSMQFIEVEDSHFEIRYREKCDEVSATLKQRAFLLAEFVQEQMSGLSFEKDCSMPSVDLHLSDLMVQLSSRLIGLGWVRSGGPLERAMLYKVLADRLAIPCALIRNGSGHACCQIAVPEVETEDDIRNDKRFPAGLLRVNYVVDLMSEPPQLLPLRSYEAIKVCGPWCNKPYTARAQMDVCKCENDEVC